MAKIEVGTLVKIVGGRAFDPRLTRFIGHVGRVLRPGPRAFIWEIEGAEHVPEGNKCGFHEMHLQPIDPPKTTTWDHVSETTGGWNPVKQKELDSVT